MRDQTDRLPLDPCRFCEKAATKADRVCDEHWEQLRRYLSVRYASLLAHEADHTVVELRAA